MTFQRALCPRFHRDPRSILGIVSALPVDPLVELVEVELAAQAAAQQRPDMVNVVKEALQAFKGSIDVLRGQALQPPQMALRGLFQSEGGWSAHGRFTCGRRGDRSAGR